MRALAILLVAAACRSAAGSPGEVVPAAPEAPSGCRTVTEGMPLQALLDAADAGAALCLAPGRYAGPLTISRRVTLWGPRGAVITARTGAVVTVTGEGAALAGMTIDGTGGSFDALDAAVKVTGHDIRIEGVAIVHAVYGILVERSARVAVLGNHVHGDGGSALGLRGDTIRLWETTDSVIDGNLVEDGRDVVVWYSRRNQITNNRILRGRYGAHFMYSHDNVVRSNELRGGVVGVFAMYSRGLVLDRNVIVDAAGAAGMAIGLKESGNLDVTANVLVHDAIGIYIDNSPLQLGDTLSIRGNALRLDQVGIVFHSSGHRVSIEDNDLADNAIQVRVDGGGSATDVVWHSNYFDDYAGYDLDGDGFGDVPYQLRSLSAQLISNHADLALFRDTPAFGLVDAASHLDPLFQPALVLSDERPRMASSVEVP